MEKLQTNALGNLVWGAIILGARLLVLGVSVRAIIQVAAGGALFLAPLVGLGMIGYGVWSIRESRDQSAKIVVDAEGIEDLRTGTGKIRWDQIAETKLKMSPVNRMPIVRLELRPDAPQIGKGPMGGPFIDIFANELNGGYRGLLDSILRHAPHIARSGF